MNTRVISDARGAFVKTYVAQQFQDQGLRTDWREEYFSSSIQNVVRGMHFQTPPDDHAKMVFCVAGAVRDVVLDLRRGSGTYGWHVDFALSAENGVGLYIPSGCAHGFVSTSESSTMYYKVTSLYSPSHDAGVAWDSFGFDWATPTPILSDRDRAHPALESFDTPFEGAAA